MKYLLFLVIFVVWFLAVIYTIVRGGQAFSLVPVFRWIFVGTMIFSALCFVAGMIIQNKVPTSIIEFVSFVGNSFFLFSIYCFAGFLFIDLISAVVHFIPTITDFSKTRFWLSVGMITCIIVIMAIGHYRFQHPEKVLLNVASSKPLQHKKLKIVSVSDLHLGTSIRKEWLDDKVKKINSYRPDIVLIAGDLVDRSLVPVVGLQLDEELRQINAPLGVYAVFGNHEYLSEADMSKVKDFYQKANIKLLCDSVTLLLDSLYIAGRDDKTNPDRKALHQILAGTDKSKPLILLDHQPYNLEEAENENVDLQLSGHTHNGQFFPINLVVSRIFEKGYGYMKKGDTNYYISSGLGIWGPQYRIGSQSEMVVINFSY